MADKMISTKLDEELVEKLDKYSKDEGRTKKWVLETALKDFFVKVESEK